jgi:hypothetical protein
MSRLFTLRNLLLATAAALLVALGVQTDWGSNLALPQLQARTGVVKHDAAAVLPDFRLGSEAGAYGQIVERPLLNPSRRPAPTQLVTAAPEPPKPQVRRGLYQLVGITDLGSIKIAQLREVASNRIKSVRQGDQLQEMTVAKVEPTQVTLAFQGETDVIEMAKFTASGRVPQPAAPPAPAPVVAQAQPQAAATVAAPQVFTQAQNMAVPAPPPVVDVARMLEMRRAARTAGVADPTDPAVIEERRRAFAAARSGNTHQP